jgi:Spy/CpxP family protein refolding chaperone
MKKWSVGLLMSFLSLGCFAQVQRNIAPKKDSAEITIPGKTLDGKSGQSKKENKREMIRSLNLSKEQQQKLREMRQASKARKQDIENNDLLTEQQKKEQLRELYQDAAGNFRNILSEEQRAILKEIRKGNE